MTSDSAHLPAVTEDTIRAVWFAHQLGVVTHTTQPLGGVRNLCFFVNDSFVVRFNTQDRGSAKFQSERMAYELLAEHSLPVPLVLVLDESHTITPYDFIITTRLPGQSLALSWQSLSADQLHTLIYAAGQCLARIHACTFPAFGKLHSLNHSSWASYVHDYVKRHLRPAYDMHLFDAALCAAIEHSLDHAMSDLARVTQPALIHCDFHYENILHIDGHLSGILDFEWALAGDPAYDFMIGDVRERMVPHSEGAFIAGYKSIRSFSPNHSRRVHWYQVFLQLEEAVTYRRVGDSRNTAIALQRLRQLVDVIDQF
jgi:Ser/Thr protein kinase RdoA (MazF antagonist)